MLRHLEGFRLVIPEARGHGRTPVGSRPLTIPEMAADLGEVLAEVGGGVDGVAGLGGVVSEVEGGVDGVAGLGGVVSEVGGVVDGVAGLGGAVSQAGGVIVLGFSDGANVAVEWASEHGGGIRGLVLVGGNLHPRGLRWFSRVTMLAALVGLKVAGLVSARARARAVVWRLMTLEPRIDPSRLGHIRVPTVVVAGERDVVRPSHTRLIARSIPGADLVIIPRKGHMLPTEAPRELAEVLRAFAATLPD